ncbi:hypothetical protein JSE7799_00204 [Jannaschia seosinensis]|uniref:Uncharacterized protein n=1 Tax=Jannaschia seosinensis TaxID=313367 RepID=A0A0M7B5B9_9RHOB|nr:hypothetical protein JSE7799_00204 [Jannaschia seosinensis]
MFRTEAEDVADFALVGAYLLRRTLGEHTSGVAALPRIEGEAVCTTG